MLTRAVLAVLLAIGARSCAGQRSAARAAADCDALDRARWPSETPAPKLCETRDDGYACMSTDGWIYWCPLSRADPCHAVDDRLTRGRP